MKTLEGCALAAAMLWGSLAAAQPGPPPPDRRPFERIEQWKKVRLIETLGLNEDQSARFIARMNEHDASRRALLDEKMKLLDQVEQLVKDHAPGGELRKIFPKVTAVDDSITKGNNEFFYGLSDILTAEQMGQLLLFQRHFERELREAMREVSRRRHREPGP